MDNRRAIAFVLVILVSLGVASGAVWGAWRVTTTYDAALRVARLANTEVLVEVPVLGRTLGAGTVVTAEDLQMASFPQEYVPASAIRKKEELVGATVKERLLQGEMIRPDRLAPRGASQGLSAIVPQGLRALSLNLRDGDQVSGFVEPGAWVDVIVTLPPPENPPAGVAPVAETLTLLQAARVLAVDLKISETADGGEIRVPQITLSVLPDDVQRVTAAIQQGKVRLTLRSDIDMLEGETRGATATVLLGRDDRRLTVSEYRERVTDEDLARMVEIVMGPEKAREKVIDPALLRPPD